LTGAGATAASGTVTAVGSAVASITGASATAAAGSVSATASGSAVVTLPSASATASVGAVTATGGAVVAVSGAQATAEVGTVTASSATNASVTLGGTSASASAGSITATGGAQIILPSAWATAAVGSLTATGSGLSTIGRPASDTSNSGWTASTGSDLYAMLDEVTPDAADYIVATSVGAVCELALNTTSYPGTASQVLKFRGSSSTGNSVIVRLKNTGGATVRSATQLLTAVDTEYSITLSAGEIAAITSGALSVQLESA
jgi:hypothetical protein